MALQADAIADILISTQKQLGPNKWTDIATDLQEYVALPQILKKERVMFDSGYTIQWNVNVSFDSDRARNVGLFGVDNVNVADSLKTASIPWRHTTADYAFERRLVKMNSSASKIVDEVKKARSQGMLALAQRMEENFWSKPADSTDTVMPFGIDYWIVRDTSEGFNGGNPTGFSSGAAGLSSTTYPNWANWTAQYTNVTRTDAVRKLRKAMTFTKFMSPVNIIPSYNKGDRYGLYTNYDVIYAMEELAEGQNDNLGSDVASMDGKVLVRRTPLTWVPYLDADSDMATYDPIYGVNWGCFNPVFLQGEYMVEDPPEKAPNQHTVYVVHIDCSYNFLCTDRRRLFLVCK